jgi:hypothetical protein
VHGSDLDMGVSIGYCGVRDSYVLLKSFVGDNPKYSRKLKAARKRPKVLGRLDLDISRNLAPVAVMRTYNNRYFFSDRVDPRSLAYSGAYSDWSIPALSLK